MELLHVSFLSSVEGFRKSSRAEFRPLNLFERTVESCLILLISDSTDGTFDVYFPQRAAPQAPQRLDDLRRRGRGHGLCAAADRGDRLVCRCRGFGGQSFDHPPCGVLCLSLAARLSRSHRPGARRRQSHLCRVVLRRLYRQEPVLCPFGRGLGNFLRRLPRVCRAARPVRGFPARTQRLHYRHRYRQPLQSQTRRHYADRRRRLSRPMGVRRARHLPAARSNHRSVEHDVSLQISRRAGAPGNARAGRRYRLVYRAHRRPEQFGGDFPTDRRHVRQFPGRDQNRDRAGVSAKLFVRRQRRDHAP